MYFVKYGSAWLHDPRVEGVLLSSLTFEANENESEYLTFKIDKTHPMFDDLEPRNTTKLIEVYDDKLSMDDPYFQGYIYEVDTDFYLTAEVKCKGVLSFLNDGILRPYSTLSTECKNVAPNTPFLYFRWLLGQYNSSVESSKRFVEGINQANMLDENEYIYRSNSNYTTVGDEIKTKLIGELGGYIRTRVEGGARYLDYIADFEDANAQVLDFGVNLTDFTRTDDAEDIVTAVVPLGSDMSETTYSYNKGYVATADTSRNQDKTYYVYDSKKKDYSTSSDDPFKAGVKYYEHIEANDESKQPLTISALADGKMNADVVKAGDHIYSASAVQKYGFIYGTYENSDITVRENLLTKAVTALNENLKPRVNIEIKAFDLALIEDKYKPIRIGEYVRVRSVPHNFDSFLMCTDVSLDLVNPSNSTYTMGFMRDSLTKLQSARIAALNATVNHVYQATDAISQEAKDAAQAAADASGKATEAADGVADLEQKFATLKGKFLYIRYSAHADGSDMTDAPTADTEYMGIYSGDAETAPEDASEYVWSLIKGTDGVGVKGDDGAPAYLHIKYSNDGTTFTANGGETAGEYIGTYSDNIKADSTKFADYTWAKIRGEQGIRGLQGEQGIQGEPGSDGVSSYFHVKYAPVDNPTASQMTENADTYIGTYVDYTEADSTDPTKYKWVRLEGAQGEKGEQGIPGVGTDGRTSYLHIKYSNDGGKTFTSSSGETVGTYIGTCTDFNSADPTTVASYKWALIKGDKGETGDDGTGIKSTTITYQASTSGITVPTGTWSSSIPTVAANQYLWTRTVFAYTDNTSSTAYSIGKIGANGSAGVAGKGVQSTAITYQASSSGTVAPTGTWSTTIPSVSESQYLWTRTITTYTDNTSTTAYSVGMMGAKGDQGVSCTQVVEQYYLSSSISSLSGGAWSTTCPAWQSGRFIWTRSQVTFSDGSVKYTTAVVANALNTANSTATSAVGTADAAQQVASDAQAGVDNIVAGKPLMSTWAGEGSDGYVYIGDITYSGSWLNQPIKLNISQRGRSSYNVIFRWENDDSYQSVETLTTSRKDVSVVAVQWDYQHASLYVLKSESYDTVNVMKVENPYEPTEVSVLLGSDDEIYQLSALQESSAVGVVVSSVDEECATNYMEFVDGEGLVVGNMTADVLGNNTLIDADGMAIRSGETELARFGDDEIHLGMNSTNSTIDLCNGSGSISGNTNGTAGLSLKGTGFTEIGGYRSTSADPSDFCGMRIDEDGNTTFNGDTVSIQNSVGNRKVVLDGDSMDIVVDNVVSASFGGDEISLCGNSGNISAQYVGSDDFGIPANSKSLTMVAGDKSETPDNASSVSVGSSDASGIEVSECSVMATSKYGSAAPKSARVSVRAGTAITSSGMQTKTLVQIDADSVKFNGGGLPVASGGTGATTAAEAVANLKNPLVDLIYPVGAIYLSTTATSPATLFGGSWTQIKDRFLLAAGSTYSAGTTGGAATHKLTESEMPSHSHAIAESNGASGGTWRLATFKSSGTNTSMRTNANGGGNAHNNMPPYTAVYVWKRTG